jgi:type VI secretion system secreted protein Hcp
MAVVDYFLKIDGIDGESGDAKHKGEIVLQSWSWGASQSGTFASGTGGGGAGKVQMQDFHFVMQQNKASPKLMLACASGEHIKKAVLTCRKAGKEQQEFLKITLQEVLVSSYQSGGSASSDLIPQEQISLNYAKSEMEYKPQKPDGTLDASVRVGWDLVANKKI